MDEITETLEWLEQTAEALPEERIWSREWDEDFYWESLTDEQEEEYNDWLAWQSKNSPTQEPPAKRVPDCVLPTPAVFTAGIMDVHSEPLAAYLEPEGWQRIMDMRRPNSKTWLKYCPQTFSIAETLFNGLSQKKVWGKQNTDGWLTMIAGKEIKTRTKRFPQQPMKLIDVLNALGNPRHYALGSHDMRLSSHAKESRYFVPTCARISVTLRQSVSKFR